MPPLCGISTWLWATRQQRAAGTPRANPEYCLGHIIAQADGTPGFAGSTDTTYVGYIVPTKKGVYWDNDSGGSVMRSALDGSSTTPAVHTVIYPSQLAANATHLYFNAVGQILRIPL